MKENERVTVTRGRRRGQVMTITAVIGSSRQLILDGIWLYSFRSVRAEESK